MTEQSTSVHQALFAKDPVRILSINGGGVGDAIPAMILKEIRGYSNLLRL